MGDSFVTWCVSLLYLLCFNLLSVCDFVLLRFVVLDRPLLNSVWKERISRVLEIEDRCYSIFIEPDLLASFSFRLAPNAAVKALIRANKKCKLFL